MDFLHKAESIPEKVVPSIWAYYFRTLLRNTPKDVIHTQIISRYMYFMSGKTTCLS